MAELESKCNLEGLKCKEAYSEGSPAEELAKLTRSEGADLLVIGSHGSTSAASAVIGSVAAKTVRAVPCSIWIETDPSFKRGFLKALAAIMGLGD
jgi:nucleotide-binding universal stress UspA family protein